MKKLEKLDSVKNGEKDKKEGKMRTNILKAVLFGIIALFLSTTLAHGDVNVATDNNVFRVVVTNDSPEPVENWIGITSYCEEYVIDGVRIGKEVTDIEYNQDGLVASETIVTSHDGEDQVIEFLSLDLEEPGYGGLMAIPEPPLEVPCYGGLMAFPEIPPDGYPVSLGTFSMPLGALDWRVYDIVVTNLDTGEVLGELEYSPSDTTQELQLINEKLDVIANSVNGVNNKIERNQRIIMQWLCNIRSYVRAIWRRIT